MEPAVYTVEWDRPLTEGERRALAALLPPEGRRRAAAMRRERGDQSLAAWGLLALGCREVWGLASLPEPAAEPGGRPWFPDRPDRCFSLSHTAGLAACALWDRPIGVDVERRRKVSEGLAARLGARDGEDFLRRWVRREAAAKRRGLGGAAVLLEPVPGEADCRLFPLGGGALLALAAEGTPRLESLDWAAFLGRLFP